MSSRSLDDLRPEIRPMADDFLKACADGGLDILVTCTLRSWVEQDALYAQGRTLPGKIVTRARCGQSAHNFGLALDIVPIVNGKACWDGAAIEWAQAGEIGERCGLEWFGAPDSPYYELAHFQLRTWELVIQQEHT